MNQQTGLEREIDVLKQLTGITVQVEAKNSEEEALAIKQLRCLCAAYREKYDRNYFLRELISGESRASANSVISEARRFHIDPEKPWILYLLRTDSGFDDTALQILKNLFPVRLKVYAVPMDEKTTALLYPAKETESSQEIQQTARTIADTLNMEALISVQIAYSGILPGLCALAEGYRDTSLALRIGRLFYPEQTIFAHNRLRVGRLIDQLPKPVCRSFLSEIFGTKEPGWLNEEFASVIDKFFQNNLNIAETARQSHMHRNSLIYRLEQVQKRTGLDLRRFEDAMVFRVASMILNYMKAEEDDWSA